jgi:hypothetical protein
MAVREVEVIDPAAALQAAHAGGGGMGMPSPGGMGMGALGRPPAGAGDGSVPGAVRLKEFDFIVQFCWQPKTPSERRDAKKAAEKPK